MLSVGLWAFRAVCFCLFLFHSGFDCFVFLAVYPVAAGLLHSLLLFEVPFLHLAVMPADFKALF